MVASKNMWCYMDCSPLGSTVHRNSPGKNTGVTAVPSPPRDLPDPGIELVSLMSAALAGSFFTTSATWEASGNWISSVQVRFSHSVSKD